MLSANSGVIPVLRRPSTLLGDDYIGLKNYDTRLVGMQQGRSSSICVALKQREKKPAFRSRLNSIRRESIKSIQKVCKHAFHTDWFSFKRDFFYKIWK